MIAFKIGSQKYKISTIRIRDYYAIRGALLLKHDELAYDLVSMLTDCPVADLKTLNPQTWLEIWTELEVMIEKDLTRDLEARTKIKLDGVEYGLVNFDDMSIGEFADLDVIMNSSDMENRLHEVMAILYRPIASSHLFKYTIESYDVKTYQERAQKFLDLPIKCAKAVMSFFLSSAIASSGLMNLYSELPKKEKKEMETLLLQILIGRGTQHSYISLMKILLKSTGLQDSEFEKHLISLFGEQNKSEEKMNAIVKWLNNITLQDDLVS